MESIVCNEFFKSSYGMDELEFYVSACISCKCLLLYYNSIMYNHNAILCMDVSILKQIKRTDIQWEWNIDPFYI